MISIVTVALPPDSEIDDGRTVRVNSGASSSSVIVSASSSGSVTPWLLSAVPDTRTVLFGASTSLLLAVIVTVPVLVV